MQIRKTYYFLEIKRFLFSINALLYRELKTRISKSTIGLFGVFAEPGLTLLVFIAFFSIRKGSDVTITAFSIMVGKALEAAEILSEKGIDAEVIDLRSLRPLDIELIVNSVKKTNRLISCEEGFPFAGIGAELGMQVNEKAFDYLDAPIMRVTGKDVPMPYAANLEALTLPQSDEIVQAALQVCYKEEEI